jgi:hypothetical protein
MCDFSRSLLLRARNTIEPLSYIFEIWVSRRKDTFDEETRDVAGLDERFLWDIWHEEKRVPGA